MALSFCLLMLIITVFTDLFRILRPCHKMGALHNGAILLFTYANYLFVCLMPVRSCRALA